MASLHGLNKTFNGSSLLIDMDWTLFRDNDDHMVPEPQEASHMTWVNGGDLSQITWKDYGDPMAGWDGGKKLTAFNRLYQTQSLKEQVIDCKEPTGWGTEDFSYVCQSSESEFQFKPPSANAGDFYSRGTIDSICTGTGEAGLSNNMLAGKASLCMDHSVYEDESTSELSASCPFSLMNTRPEGVDGLFEGEHLVDRADDLLEHPWENIDNLSSLEEMDNIFLEPLFQTDTPDMGNMSQAQNLFSGSQSTSPANMMQLEAPLSHGCVESLRTSNEMSYQKCPEYLKKRQITASLNHGTDNSSKDIKLEDNCYTQPSCATSSHSWRTENSAAVKLGGVVQSGSVSIEDGPYRSEVCKPSISQGPLMTLPVSDKAHGAYDEKLLAEEEDSLEAVVLHELEASMMRLDVRTRICIRDALYRLARSSRQRHAASEGGSAKIESGESSNSVDGSKPPFFIGHSSNEGVNLVETQTNPIDRAIANLLFHKQSAQSAVGLGNLCMSASFDGKIPVTSMVLGPQHQWDWQPAIVSSSNSSMMLPLTSVEVAHLTSDGENKVPRVSGRTNLTPEQKNRSKAKMHTNHIRTSGAGFPCPSDSQKSTLVPYPLLQRRGLHYCLGMGALGSRPEAHQLIGISADLKGCILSNPMTQGSVQAGTKAQRGKNSVEYWA